MGEEDVLGPSADVVESEDVQISTTEKLVVSSEGGVSCDVWVRVPVTWLASGEVALFGVVGSARVELGRVALAEVTGTTSSGVFHATCLMARGRPCDGFEATLRWTGAGGIPLSMGRVILQVFGTDTPAVIEKRPAPRGTTESPLILRTPRSPAVEVTLSPTTSEVVVQTLPEGSACDVWVRVPDTWKVRVEVTLYGLLGNNRVELFRKHLTDAPGKSAAGIFTGHAISLRSRPCDGFEVAIRDIVPTMGAFSGNGFLTAQAFDAADVPVAMQASPPDGTAANPFQQRLIAPPSTSSAAFSLSLTETVVASSGPGTHCDVWIKVPDSWKPRMEVALWGSHGTARVELLRTSVANAPGTSAGGSFSAIVAAARGRYAESFEVSVRDTIPTGSPGGTGIVRIQPVESSVAPLVQQQQLERGSSAAPVRQQVQALSSVDSGALTNASTTETTVATATGATDCDVWVRVPDAWKPDLQVVLYGTIGLARVELARVMIADCPGTSSGGNFSAVAISSRGKRCDSFNVAWRSMSGSTLTGTGRVYIQPADVGTPPRVRQSEDARPAERAVAVPITTTETTIARLGPASGCDVWAVVPNAWASSSARLRLYGIVGGIRVLLRESNLASGLTGVPNGSVHGVPIAVRGRQCSSFEATLRWSGTTPPSGTGTFLIQPTELPSLPRSEGDPLPDGTSSSPLYHRLLTDALPEMYAGTASVTLGTGAKTVGYLWSTGAKSIYITKIIVASATTSSVRFQAQRISTETTQGGPTSEFRGGSSAPAADVKEGGTTTATSAQGLLFDIVCGGGNPFTWTSSPSLSPIVLPSGTAAGLRVFTTTTGTWDAIASFEWYEV